MKPSFVTTRRTGLSPSFPTLLMLGLLLVASPPPPAAAAARAGVEEASGPSSNMVILSLDDARAMAQANDESLAQARLAIEGARADVRAAGADRLPQLSLAGTWTRNLQKAAFFLPPDMAAGFGGNTKIEMGRDQDLQAALSLTVNLWTAGRLSAATGAASEALEATRWQETLVTDVVRYTVDAAYADALLAAEQVYIAEGALDATVEARRIAAAGFEQGSTSRFDLLRAEVEQANREAPLIQARNALAIAELNLKRICGLDPEAVLELDDAHETVDAPADLDTLLARQRSGSAELQALDRMVAMRRQQVSLAKAGRGPVLQLQGNMVLQGQWDDGLTPGENERATSSSVALAVSLPIFDGFAAKASIQGATVDLRTAEIERDRVACDRELGVRNARLNLENAQAALEGRRDGVNLAAEAHRLALVRLENGLATPLERLDAELALTEARAQLASVQHDCNIAAAALELAVGDGTAVDAATEVE